MKNVCMDMWTTDRYVCAWLIGLYVCRYIKRNCSCCYWHHARQPFQYAFMNTFSYSYAGIHSCLHNILFQHIFFFSFAIGYS